MNTEVSWNPAQVAADLSQAVVILRDRGLKASAKWAAEQRLGLGDVEIVPSSLADDRIVDASLSYAQTLLELGEYAHAGAVLSVSPSSDFLPAPLHDLSPQGHFTRAYAWYLAGEQTQHQDELSKNPFVNQLVEELQEQELDAFGMHVLGMVLLALNRHKEACDPLVESVLAFPYNWSAWLDLATCVLHDKALEVSVQELLQPLSGHYAYHFFCAHLQEEHQSHTEALDIYERWLPVMGQSPYLLTRYATVHYHLRDFASAKRLWQDIHQEMPYRLDGLDIYSNILYVQEDSVGLAQLAHAATRVDKYRPETCCIVGNYYSLKQQRAKAIQSFRRAVQLDPSFVSAWTLMGHEYVEWQQTSQAVQAYRKAVEVAPTDYRAWYGLGQTYEFLNMPLMALYYYKHAAELRPYDARMWCALGMTLSHLHRPKDAIRAYERALQQEDSEGVATQRLAGLYKEAGNEEKAAHCYMKHLHLRYRATAESPPAGGPPLDVVIQTISLEAPEAEALLYLAEYHKSHGSHDVAALLCSRLLEYPGPEKEQAKALLRDVRSRKTTAARYATSTPGSSDSFEFSP